MRQRPGLALIAMLLLQAPMGRAGPEPAQLVGTYVWHLNERWFGGFSGLELSADGTRFVVLSDRGNYASGRFARNAAGAITGVTLGSRHPVVDRRGRILPRWKADSEGLAIAPNGRMYISYEGVQRVLEYDRPGAPAKLLPRHPDFKNMPLNGSLEPLAIDGHGALYTLPERDPKNGPLKVYRYSHGKWRQPFTLPREGKFLPVGADFGPDGKFYLLERRFAGVVGFASRVRRFSFGPDGPGPGETLFQSRLGTHDNLEGLAVWRDKAGHIRLTMVSDDNFSVFQRTELVDYAVTE